MNNLKIFKVGGAALGNIDGWNNFVSLINSIGEPSVVVISALNLTTRELKNAAKYAEIKEIEKANSILNKIFDFHNEFAYSVLQSNSLILFQNNIVSVKDKLIRLFQGVYLTGFLSNKTLDSILSFGEILALELIKALFNNNHTIETIDSGEIIITNSNFGEAVPIIEQCDMKINTKIKPLLESNKIIITQGFSGKTIDGFVSTMGIESSNLTATLLADLLNANELHIRTNVTGIFNADPKQYSNTKIISQLSYNDAKKAAMNGLKLIYADMINIAEQKNIKIFYESGVKNENFRTIIDNQQNTQSPMIIVQNNISNLKINFNSYSERRSVIDDILNYEKIRANIIFSNFMEDYIQIVVNGEFDESNFDIQNIEIFNNFDLIKVLFAENYPKFQSQLEEFNQQIYSINNIINNDLNFRLLVDKYFTNRIVEKILEFF